MSSNPKRTAHAREIMRDAPWVSYTKALRMADAELTANRDERTREVSRLLCRLVVPTECVDRVEQQPIDLHEPELQAPETDQRGGDAKYDQWFESLSHAERISRFRTWRFTPDSRRDITLEWAHIGYRSPAKVDLAHSAVVGEEVPDLTQDELQVAQRWAQRSALLFHLFDDHVRLAMRGAFFWGVRDRVEATGESDRMFGDLGIDHRTSTLDAAQTRLEDPAWWERTLPKYGIGDCLTIATTVPMLDELPNDPNVNGLMLTNAETIRGSYAAALTGGGMWGGADADELVDSEIIPIGSAHGGQADHRDV